MPKQIYYSKNGGIPVALEEGSIRSAGGRKSTYGTTETRMIEPMYCLKHPNGVSERLVRSGSLSLHVMLTKDPLILILGDFTAPGQTV